jgi:hypothetical protein
MGREEYSMTIENLGVKLYSGTKSDRKSDSLGSSADGANTGIILTPIKTNRTTNKIDFTALRDGANHALSYDLGATLSDTLWVCRFVINFSKLGSSGNGNYLYVGLSDKDSSTGQDGNQDFIGTQIQIDGTSYYYSNDSDGGAIPSTGSGDNNQSWTPVISTNYYVEMIRSADDTYSITIRTGSHSGTSLGTVAGTCATTTVGLRYFKVLNVVNSSGGRDLEGTIDTIGIDNGTSTWSSADYTVNPNSTTGWTGQYKLGTGAYEFDGTDDFVNLGTDSALNLLNGGTVTMWVNTDNITDKRFAGKGSNGAWELLSETTDNKVKFRVNDGSVKNVIGTTALSDGTWYHIAGVYDKSAGEIRLYVNGTLENTTTGIGQIATISTPAYLGRNEGGNYYDGTIDDVGIWNRVLTATEIGKLANNNTPASQGWTLAGTGASISNGWLQQNSRANASDFSYYDMEDVLGSGQTMATNWILRFKMDTNSFTNSSTGQGIVYGVSFYDSTSLSGWYPTADGLGMKIQADASTDTGNWYAVANNGGTATTTMSANFSEPYDVVRYCEIAKTSGQIVFKVFSDEYSTEEYSLTRTFTEGDITGLRYLGFRMYAQNVSHTNGVKISEVKIYNNQTSPTTLTKEFTFTSGNAQLVSSLTNKSELKAYYSMDSTDGRIGSGCASFNGSSSTIDIGNGLDSILSSDFTFATWAYMPNATSSSNKTIICKPATTSWANPYHSFTIQHTGGNIDFQTNNGSTNVNIDLACGQGWHHIAVTKSGTTFTLYIDGSTSESQTISGTSWGTQDWIIGNTPYNTRYFDGYVDDMTWWNTALSSSDITSLAGGSASNTIATSNLVRRYPLDTNSNDSVGSSNGTDSNITYISPVCPNDFSSTSDLEALTGIRTNSIFQQTDDTPSYWWYNGTSWVLDGTSTWDSNFAQFSTQAEGEAKWITSDSSRLNYGGVGSGSDSNKYIDWDLRNDNSNDTIYYNLGKTVNSSKWVLRFKINFSDLASNTSTQGLLGLSSITGSADSTQDFLGIAFLTGDDQIRGISTDSNPNGIPSTYSASIDWQEDTDYYIQIERTSATAFKAYVRTGSYSGTTLASITNGVTTSAIGGLQYIKIQNRITNNSPSPRLTIQEVGLLDGFSEWE